MKLYMYIYYMSISFNQEPGYGISARSRAMACCISGGRCSFLLTTRKKELYNRENVKTLTKRVRSFGKLQRAGGGGRPV